MGRFCYISKILPGKTHLVREMWRDRTPNEEPHLKTTFWNFLQMNGFESWLQPMPQGDFLVHCLEGTSLQHIFKGLREQIAAGNPIALKLQNFYQIALGKNYQSLMQNLISRISLIFPSPPLPKRLREDFFIPFCHIKKLHTTLLEMRPWGTRKAAMKE
jgi:hypothetical protein